jgi:hypothetical protein
VLDSRHWKLAEASLPFQLDGDSVPTSRTTSRRTWISSAEGRITSVGEGHAFIEGEHSAALRHSLPAYVDLTPLIGRRVRITLMHTAPSLAADAGVTQTLTIAGTDGRLYVIAHAGHVRGNAHTLGKVSVYVALSQRPGGPMVFGTARLQSLVRVGESVRVRDGEDLYVMSFQSRPANGTAAYVITSGELSRDRNSNV